MPKSSGGGGSGGRSGGGAGSGDAGQPEKVVRTAEEARKILIGKLKATRSNLEKRKAQLSSESLQNSIKYKQGSPEQIAASAKWTKEYRSNNKKLDIMERELKRVGYIQGFTEAQKAALNQQRASWQGPKQKFRPGRSNPIV